MSPHRPSSWFVARSPNAISAVVLTCLLALSASATDYYWDADGDATASTGYSNSVANNWSEGASYLTWRDGGATGLLRSWGTVDATAATAVFGGDLAGSVNVWGYYGLSANGLRFERNGYTLTSSPITLVGTTPTITTNTGISATIASELKGTAGLVKAGAGYLTLNRAATYTGATTIDGGTLYLSYVGGNLSSTSAVTINTGGTLYFQAAEQLNNAASLTINGGTLQLNSTETVGAVTMTGGKISTGTLSSNVSFALESGTVDAALAGTASLTKTTAGTVTLTGQNTFTGATVVSGGTLDLYFSGYSGHTNRTLGNTSSLTITNGATVKLSYSNEQINDSATLTIDNATFSLGTHAETVAGVSLDGGGVIKSGQLTSTTAFDFRSGTVTAGLGGAAGLNKTTGGTVTLNQQLNSDYIYTGATSIAGGTLVVNGILSSSTAEKERVTVGTGATLTGAGSVLRPITVSAGGRIAAGDPASGLGILTTGAQIWADGSTAAFRLGNTAADRLQINGTLAAGATTIALTSYGLVPAGLTNTSWTLARATGGITGFSNLSLDTAGLGALDGAFSLSLANADTLLMLNYAAVPEPATCALLGGIAALGAVFLRRRKAARANRS